ncbi:MAG: hypothetical protein ACYCTY_01970 [Sulfuricella sp.]
MKNALLKFLGALLFLFVGLVPVSNAQETPQPFPIVSSTLDRPFKIIRNVTQMVVINTEQGVLGLSTEDAISAAYAKGMSGIESFARKNGADAVINTSFQVVLIPGRGNVGVIFFFGTLVKVKEDHK